MTIYLWFCMEIRGCFAALSSHSLPWFYRTWRGTSFMAGLPDLEVGWENLIAGSLHGPLWCCVLYWYVHARSASDSEPETWKGAKSGRLFLQARKVASLVFQNLWIFPDSAEHQENLPSFQCQKGKKKPRMPLKFSKLFPYTLLKWICLTRISLVIFFWPNLSGQMKQGHSINSAVFACLWSNNFLV